jgi:hypothetical protein
MPSLDAVRTEEVNGLTISILPDDSGHTDSPVEDGDGAIFAVLHRRYINPAAKRTEGDFNSVDGIEAFIKRNKGPRAKWAVFSLFMYDHSGTAYACSENGSNPFIGRAPHAEWDSGRVGIIALQRSRGVTRETLYEYAQGICRDYTAWANGDVYGYVIEDATGEEISSCWGYYSVDEALAEAEGEARAHARQTPATTESE